MSERIEITFLKKIESEKTNIIATFGIHIKSMDLFMSKCKLIKKNDGGIYVAPPSEEYTDTNGSKKWANFWWFGESSSTFFQTEVRKALDTYTEKKSLPSFFKQETS